MLRAWVPICSPVQSQLPVQNAPGPFQPGAHTKEARSPAVAVAVPTRTPVPRAARGPKPPQQGDVRSRWHRVAVMKGVRACGKLGYPPRPPRSRNGLGTNRTSPTTRARVSFRVESGITDERSMSPPAIPEGSPPSTRERAALEQIPTLMRNAAAT